MSKNIKMGFMIIAHNNFDQLNVFIKQLLDYPNSYIYIFVDIKSNEFDTKKLITDSRIKLVENRFSLDWGDVSLVKATLELMEQAQEASLDYVSLCSGADLAIQPVSSFADFLDSQLCSVFIEANKMPVIGWGHGHGGLERIELGYPKWLRVKATRRSWVRYARGLYQVVGSRIGIIHKSLPGIDFYGGSQWFTVDGEVLRRSLSYIEEHPEYSEIFADSLCSDEIFFNTLFLLPEVRGRNVNTVNNLRYIDWSVANTNDSGSPKLLSLSDYATMTHSGKFLARKFNMKTEKAIVDKIIKYTRIIK